MVRRGKEPQVIEVIQIGNDLGITLPRDVCARLNLNPGDVLDVAEVGDGFELTKDRDFSETMRVVKKVIEENREVLRRLADS